MSDTSKNEKKNIRETRTCAPPGEEQLWLELQEAISYTFSDPHLLAVALTHPSCTQVAGKDGEKNNQRMEFLGDAVLELCVSDLLYHEHSEKDEGWMTRTRSMMVREEALFEVAKHLQLGRCLRMSPSEERNGGRHKPSILSDAVESLICGIYLDGGWSPARDFVLRFVPRVDQQMESDAAVRDPKTRLQEWLQRDGSVTIRYEIVAEHGAAHDRRFDAQVSLEGTVLGSGSGHSKKEAEQMAALKALQRLQAETE